MAALAFDQDTRRIYFINNNATTAQNLGYLDMNRTPVTAVDLGVQIETATGAGYNIIRMTVGLNGNYYALTDNAQDLIRFNIDATGFHKVNSGPLFDDVSNGTHTIATETNGDMVCDGSGKLYLITGVNNVYMIDPLTRIAKFINTITGISTLFPTTSAAITNDGKLYVGGGYGELYLASLVTFTATKIGNSLIAGDYATCSLPMQLLRVATNERPTANNPVVERTNEVLAKIQPNPFHNELSLQVRLNTTEQVRVKLIDFFGRTVYTASEKMTAGVNSLHLPVPANLGSGVYVVELWTGDKRLVQKKIVKQ